MVPIYRYNWRSKWLEGMGYRKAVCIKVRVNQARKPNSGLRKVAKVQLPNKRVIQAYIPGIGHNLQAHSVVLVKGGRTHDVRGCNYKLVRGRYDLLPVKNRARARSRYGVKRPKKDPISTRFKTIANDKDVERFRTMYGKDPKDIDGKDIIYTEKHGWNMAPNPWPLFRAKPPFAYGPKKRT